MAAPLIECTKEQQRPMMWFFLVRGWQIGWVTERFTNKWKTSKKG